MEKRIETQHGSFRVRPYRSDDEAGVLSLWEAAFGKELSPSLWRWKYLKNPYPVQIGVAVDDDERVLVLYGGIPYRANWNGNQVSMTHLMDIMSHPDCRGSGLFVKTGAAFFDLFAGPERTLFYYGFPGKYHFDIGRKYLRYTALEGGVGFLTAETEALAQNRSWSAGRAERMTNVDPAFDALWRRYAQDYPLAVIRDAAFLKWRFFENPLHEYELWVYKGRFRQDGKAYAVLALEGEKARMVDLFAPPSGKIIPPFLAELGRGLCERGVREMETWLPQDHFMAQFAMLAGFRPCTEPLGFIPTGRSFHPGLSLGWASNRLYYTMADGDLL